MSALAVSKVAIVRAMAAFAAAGSPVLGARLSPDGSITLLTTVPEGILPANDEDGDWVSLAGETEIPRAKGA